MLYIVLIMNSQILTQGAPIRPLGLPNGITPAISKFSGIVNIAKARLSGILRDYLPLN